tara:strand:- start:2413 stop:2694 length:282 start_codon:yes stop_codon:yes gene_type:complete
MKINTASSHLKAFNEGALRMKMIRKEIVNMMFDEKRFSYLNKISLSKNILIDTTRELISQGEKYLSACKNTDEHVRVAIDVDEYRGMLNELVK